jgi:hypothetical protein
MYGLPTIRPLEFQMGKPFGVTREFITAKVRSNLWRPPTPVNTRFVAILAGILPARRAATNPADAGYAFPK